MIKTLLATSLITFTFHTADAVKLSIVNDDKDFRWNGWTQNLDPSSNYDERNLKIGFCLKTPDGKEHKATVFTPHSSQFTVSTPFVISISFDAEFLIDHKISTLSQEIVKGVPGQANDHLELRLTKVIDEPIGLFYTLSNINNPKSPVILTSKMPRPSPEGHIDDVGGDYTNAQDDDGDTLQDAPLTRWQKFKRKLFRQ